MSVSSVGEELIIQIKRASWFPFDTGNLKYHALKGNKVDDNTYLFTFDTKVAPYIPYLEEGTTPHNIPGAFGKPLPFGTSGRFNGKFHPGSTIHKGFISNKTVNLIVNYISEKYNGVIQ